MSEYANIIGRPESRTFANRAVEIRQHAVAKFEIFPADRNQQLPRRRSSGFRPVARRARGTHLKVDGPLSVSIYPGANASFLLYEDDGSSFNYRKGEWMGIQMTWNEAARKLTLQLAPGSRMLPPERRNLTVDLTGTKRDVIFSGKSIELSFATGAGEN
jgi:hypothetical protein